MIRMVVSREKWKPYKVHGHVIAVGQKLELKGNAKTSSYY